MKKTISLLLFTAISLSCFSQLYINHDRMFVKRSLLQYSIQNKQKAILNETDSSVIFMIRDTAFQPVDVIMVFDTTGKCKTEVRSSICDSCIRTYVENTITNKRDKWFKISDTQYVSRFAQHLLLEYDPQKPTLYTIRRIDYTRKEYDALVDKLN